MVQPFSTLRIFLKTLAKLAPKYNYMIICMYLHFVVPEYCKRTYAFYFCCRFFLTGSQKRFFEKLSIYCDKYAEQIPVTFVLGKYWLHVKLFSNTVSVQVSCKCMCKEALQSWGAYRRLEAQSKVIGFQQVSLKSGCFCHINIYAQVLNIATKEHFNIYINIYSAH